jgi:hypothetical protein
MFCRVYLLVFDRSFILRAVSLKFDYLGPSGLSMVNSDLLLDWLDINHILGETHLRFYFNRNIQFLCAHICEDLENHVNVLKIIRIFK